jgi:hypothetical protein
MTLAKWFFDNRSLIPRDLRFTITTENFLGSLDGIPPLRQFFIFSGLESFLRHFLRNSSNRLKKSAAAQYLDYRGISVAKLSIYEYVRTDKGWRYCKVAFYPNDKIKPNVVVERLSGRTVDSASRDFPQARFSLPIRIFCAKPLWVSDGLKS